ncbi:hypothetical protein T02_15854 [Trichinella nativa]|uniref:Uncharacterized protein n=1 Tax=Trichinella nativa TaxID=6335 RepID=A0A0V1LCG6_9BILA|nr:hypothetical protein T06_9692 [Trichinella sp. T6]KRZ57173.1 hypothetical protein T02_15854 [Trichinella nativa]
MGNSFCLIFWFGVQLCGEFLVGLTRKRRRIVNEKRHVQKRACESARMFCLEKQCELWKPCCAISAEEVICLDALALAGADLLLLLFNIDFIDNLKSIESEEQRPNIYIRGAPISSLKAGRVRTAKKRAAQTYMIIRSLRRPILPPITLDVGCSLLTNCAEQAGKQAARLNH